MGEPLPGDIPDPTHLKTQNVLLEATQVAKKGDWLGYSTANNAWGNFLNLDPSRRITSLQAVQLQEDIDTTDILNAIANAAVFANGSWVYALIAGDVLPNSQVYLISFEDASSVFRIGFTTAINAIIDTFTKDDPEMTIVTDTPHGLIVGEKVVITGSTSAANDGTFVVTKIVSTLSFTYINAAGVAESGLAATNAENTAALNGGDAKFIKRSGDTFAQEGVVNEIGVFAMTGLGL